MYYIYHIFDKKVGATKNVKKRVEEQQGFNKNEYTILASTSFIEEASRLEIFYQKILGYKKDQTPYEQIIKNKLNMKVTSTDATSTFHTPISNIESFITDLLKDGYSWRNGDKVYKITKNNYKWIIKHCKKSQFYSDNCFIYNKAFEKFNEELIEQNEHEKTEENSYNSDVKNMVHTAYLNREISMNDVVEINGLKNRQAALELLEEKIKVNKEEDVYDLIRDWAEIRGIYQFGNSKTQYIKLMEEAGELAQALLKNDKPEIKDAIGDMMVVLTNLAHLEGLKVEDCITSAYDVIAKRKGKMINGTFVKNTL